MKHTVKQPAILYTAVFFAMCFLFSCKKDASEAAPPPVTEETVKTINSSPSVSESPATADNTEENEAQLFPERARVGATDATQSTTDFVDFNDEMALTILPDNAASTFALAPFYIQQVGTAWVHVKENNSGNYKPRFKSNYGHFHLSYENFVPCITSAGKFGKPVGSSCASINPVKEPRTLDTHDGDHWIKVYAYDYDSPSRTFDLLRIKVTNGPIQLWFKKSDGEWLHWSSIATGTWNLSSYCTSIKEVLISSAGNTSSIGFDDLKITMPAF